jgi:ribonuclease R
MMQAFYGVEPLGHFGLGFTDYTHFTSPIRRYPDLVVHRCLKSLIDGTDHPFKTAELVEIGEKTSDRERQAMRAERDMIKLKSCRLMKDRVGEVFDAMVTGVSRSGFFVTLRETPVEGMVPLRNLEDDYYHVLEDSYTVVGRRHGKRFRIGDRLEVRLAEVDLVLMRMDFDLP